VSPALEDFKYLFGELARPFAIYATTLAAFIAVVKVAEHGEDYSGGAVFVGAIYTGLAALYGWRSWEKNTVTKAGVAVEVAKAKASGGSSSEQTVEEMTVTAEEVNVSKP